MCRFVESIQLKEGQFKHIELHQLRLQKAMADFYPNEKVINLAESLNQSSFSHEGLFKCRVVYDSEIRQIEFIPYIRREIKSLRLIETDIESRFYKLENRSEFVAAFGLRGNCDDVLLVKNGLLTDTSYCNIALSDGENWYTPRIPLLYGVNRAKLIADGKLKEKDIKQTEFVNFQNISLFNAMIDFKDIILKTSIISL